MQRNVESIRAAVLSRYITLENPQFGFVQAAMKNDEYRGLIDVLRERFDVSEDTDTNDDVSFVLIMRMEDDCLVLRLSMIGRFGALFRVDKDNRSKVVDPDAPATDVERQVLETLKQFQIEPLDQSTLAVPIPLELTNTGAANCRLYQALFADTDVLPWEAVSAS